MVNRTAMYETLDKVIEVAPSGAWRQDVWVMHSSLCGTAGCFAGWRVILDGFSELVLDESGEVDALRNPQTGQHVYLSMLPAQAATSLDLWLADARELFSSDNTLEDLKELVDRLCA